MPQGSGLVLRPLMLVTPLFPHAGWDLYDRIREECDGAKTMLSQSVEARQMSILHRLSTFIEEDI